jgi:hypothetical protein
MSKVRSAKITLTTPTHDQRPAEGRDEDVPGGLPGVGAVDLGRLDELVGHGGEAGGERDDAEAGERPERRDDQHEVGQPDVGESKVQHPWVGEPLAQRPGDRRPADPMPFAQLVLGGEASIQPVVAFQDRLDQQRLELEVDRYRQRGIDRHGTPPPRLYRLECVGDHRVSSRATKITVPQLDRFSGLTVIAPPPMQMSTKVPRRCAGSSLMA